VPAALALAMALGLTLQPSQTAIAAAGASSLARVGEPRPVHTRRRPHIRPAHQILSSSVRWYAVPMRSFARKHNNFVGGTFTRTPDFKVYPNGRYPFKPDKV